MDEPDLTPGTLYDRQELVRRKVDGEYRVALEYGGTFAVVGLARDSRVPADRLVMERVDGPGAGGLHLFGTSELPIRFARTPDAKESA